MKVKIELLSHGNMQVRPVKLTVVLSDIIIIHACIHSMHAYNVLNYVNAGAVNGLLATPQ